MAENKAAVQKSSDDKSGEASAPKQTRNSATPKRRKGNITQPMIDAIERRLALYGGTTLSEIGGDLSERFGGARKEIQDIQSKLYGAPPNNPPMTKLELKEMRDKLRARLKEAREQKKQEVADMRSIAEEYIVEEYGELLRDERTRRPIGYGDRIEVVERGHLKKIW